MLKKAGLTCISDSSGNARPKSPSQEADRKSIDESKTMPNPWLTTCSEFAPLAAPLLGPPSVRRSEPTNPATDPVP